MANSSHDRQGAHGSAAAVDASSAWATLPRKPRTAASRATSTVAPKASRVRRCRQFCRLDNSRHPATCTRPRLRPSTCCWHVRCLARLEPSAGRGAIVKELRRHGLKVHASDLYDHKADPELRIKTGVDFLKTTTLFGCRAIIMNPPFKESEQHVRHALRLLPDDGMLAALLRMNWRAAKGRADLAAGCS